MHVIRSQNANFSSESQAEDTQPEQQNEQSYQDTTETESDVYSNSSEWTVEWHEQGDASQGWRILKKMLKRSSGDRPQFTEAVKADFLVPIDRVIGLGPEWYRSALYMEQLRPLDRFVDDNIKPSSKVKEFNKEFPLSPKLFKRWKDVVMIFPTIDYVRSKTSHPLSVSALELLVLARMVAIGILEVTYKRSPYQAGFFLVKKQGKKVRPITNYSHLSKYVEAAKFNLPNVFQVIEKMRWQGRILFFVKIDIKQAFYNIPLHRLSKYVTMFVWGVIRFQYPVLPFGMSLSPFVPKMFLNAICKFCRQYIQWAHGHMDDMILADSDQANSGLW